ncbi:MAG: hypothetical protein JWN04_2701 [Myxococcaceae bacterium]|nr:hypothetical protein [Myxococcaceae bacterium]
MITALPELPRVSTTQLAVRTAAWPIAFLVVISHTVWADESFPLDARVYAGLLGALALVSCAYARPHVVPVVQIVLIRFYFAMGFPVFSAPRIFTSFGRVRLSSQALSNALLGAVLFVGCFLLIVMLVMRPARRLSGDILRLLDRKQTYSSEDTVAARAFAALAIAISVANAFRGFGSSASLGPFSLLTNLLSGAELPLTLLWWDAYQTRSRTAVVLCWCAVSIISLGALSTGMLGGAVFPWLAAILLSWTLYGRTPTGLIITSILAILIVNPAKHAYRQLTWKTGTNVGALDRAENWAQAFSSTYADGVLPENAASGVAQRASSLVQVAHMYEWVPARVPHEGPDAWLRLPLYFVPTLLWPDRPRPIEEIHKYYWRSFRLLSEKTINEVSITLPSVGDGYWRLGWPGVALEGALLGLIVGFFHGIGRSTSRAATLFGVGYLLQGGGPEGQVLSMILALPKTVFVWTVVLLLVQWLPSFFEGAPKTKLAPRRERAPT